MHILVIEPLFSGHHSGYFDRIVSYFCDQGHDVTAATLDTVLDHEVILAVKRRYPDAVEIVSIESICYVTATKSRLGQVGREVALRGLFGRVYKAVNENRPVDYVFLPYLDYCLYSIGLLGSPFGETRWGGICMRPSFHYKCYGVVAPTSKLSQIKEYFFSRTIRSRTLDCVYTIDLLLKRFVEDYQPRFKSRLAYLSEPAELNGKHTRLSARASLNVPEDAVLILVYGAINERKGLRALLEAIADADVPESIRVLIVGKQSSEIQDFMKTPLVTDLVARARCSAIEGFVDASAEQKSFEAADIVWLGYQGHYTMSGVLALAIKYGKKVIATRDGLIGWYSGQYEKAVTVDIADQAQLVERIKQVAQDGFGAGPVGRAASIIGKADWVNFLATIGASLDALESY